MRLVEILAIERHYKMCGVAEDTAQRLGERLARAGLGQQYADDDSHAERDAADRQRTLRGMTRQETQTGAP